MVQPTFQALNSPEIRALLAQIELLGAALGYFEADGENYHVAPPAENVSELVTELAAQGETETDIVAKLRARIEALEKQVAERQPAPPANPPTTTKRGIKLGTAERVNEFHRLVKSGISHRQAKKQSRCDPTTYYQWCREVTGEEPITPYR